MASFYQMPAKIEQIRYTSVGTKKPLCLPARFESPHPSLSHPSRLVPLLCPIVLIPLSAMYRLGNELTMSDSIASQLVSHDFPGFSAMTSQ